MRKNNKQVFFKTGKKMTIIWGVIFTLFFMLNLNAKENAGEIIYSCGFEKEEGFGEPGSSIEGQKGWSLSVPGLKYLAITDGTVVKSKWGGGKGKQWLLLRSYKDKAVTPAFNTAKYEEVKTTFSMRPAGHPKSTKGYAGVICFLDQNNKIMTRIHLFRSGLNSGIIKMYSINKNINTGIAWEYLNKDTSLDFDLTIYQGTTNKERRWKLTMNGNEVAGFLMRASKGTLAKIIFLGAACISRHEISTIDNIVVAGVKKKISSKVAVSKMASAKNTKQEILNIRIVANATAQKMDLYYYEAGTKVDIAGFDLNELVRQGEKVPPSMLTEVYSASREMRSKWLALEKERSKVFKGYNYIPPQGENILRIKNLENNAAGESGWFGLSKAEIKWTDGTSIKLPLKSFSNCVFRSKYAYLCKPSNAIFIYGSKSRTNQMMAAFDLKSIPDGNPILILSALDDDKIGKTRIRISLNENVLFEGPNPFAPDNWTKHKFSVPKKVFSQKNNPRKTQITVLNRKIKVYAADVENFKKWANAKANKIDVLTANIRKNLVYKPLKINNKWWKKGMRRGMCFDSRTASFDPRQWLYHKPEYIVKSFRDANIDYVYGYFLAGTLKETYLDEFEKMGFPYIQPSLRFIRGWDSKDLIYFSKREQLLSETLKHMGRLCKKHKNVKAFALDEPQIIEYRRKRKFETPRIKELFGKYLEKYGNELEKADVKMPSDKSTWGAINYNNNRVLWLMRQLFKVELFSEHLKFLNDGLQQKNILLFPILMNNNHHIPQAGSTASIGKTLPIFSTDLYNNGGLWESFAMQLANNAAIGKAIMTTGSGYSCKSPDAFRRSMGTGLIHAAGILQWLELYCSKYRNPCSFWRSGGLKTDCDDRGRNPLGNWNPAFWDIQVDMYKKSKQLDKYSKNIESKAKLAILYSERTGIASTLNGAGKCKKYFQNSVSIYSDFMRHWHRPIDVIFIESLTLEKMKKYKVAILADARVLSDENMLLLTKWVKNGGTLIATAETSLYSPWGKKRKDFVMAKLFGVHFIKSFKGAKNFKYNGMSVSYEPSKPYSKVSLAKGAKLLASWDNGDPALIKNISGKGQTLFITAKDAGGRRNRKEQSGGLAGSSLPGMDRFLVGEAIKILGKATIQVSGLPEGVEVQVRQNQNGEFVLQMLDWIGGRNINGAKITIELPGKWEMFYPAFPSQKVILDSKSPNKLKSFRIYDAIIIAKYRKHMR